MAVLDHKISIQKIYNMHILLFFHIMSENKDNYFTIMLDYDVYFLKYETYRL